MGFSEEDLEGDFDPERYDEIMQDAFDDEYYKEEEVVKPEFSDDDDGMVDTCGICANAGCCVRLQQIVLVCGGIVTFHGTCYIRYLSVC